uniref:phage tail protein n=1 Tax=Planktomarina sp. TaxID=2024851 RepID=UPI0032609C75
MAVSAVVALASTAAASAGAIIAGTMTLSAFATAFAVNFALGAALKALSPKPSLSGANRGYQTTAIGTALDHQIIYGKMRVAGARIYDEATGTNNKYLHRIIAFAGHEVESFDKIYINDELATLDGSGNVTSPSRYNGKVRINLHLGASDQTADTDLVSESVHWTTEHRLRGIAYMYIRLQFDADVFPNGIPEITSTISGKKVYDPRTSTTVWSDNPALCLRDYLTSSYGISEATANIDDTLVISAANVCDQTNTDAGTTRYTCNGAFTTASTPYDMINSLLTSMDGSLWYAQGKWRMKPAYWTTPVLDLNEDDLRSNISVSTRHSRRNNFNAVKGTFRGEESNWQTTDYPQVTNADFVTADNGQESVADVDLPFTDNSVEARRIARISLERNRQQLTVSASFGLKTLQVQVGDNIRLTNSRFGWTNKEFEVVSWSFGLTEGLDLQTQMTLRETAESVYDEVDDGVVYERDNTTLLSPFDVPTVGISVVAVAQVSNQKVSNIAVATVTSGRSEEVDHVEVEYKLSSESVLKMYVTNEYEIKIVGNTDFTLYGSPNNNVGTVFTATGVPTNQNETGVVEPKFFSSFGQGQLGEFRVRDLEVA